MAAIFPGAVATQLQLLTAQNNSMVVLDVNADLDDDVITVDDASALPNSGYMTFVDTDEVIYYTAKTSNTLTGVVRGADSTTPATHLAGVDLEQRWNADYHNIVTLEQIAVEQFISDKIGLSTTQVIAPAGSNTAPAWTTLGDLDTGIYHSGANTVDVSTGGTRAATVNSSQQLLLYKTSNQIIVGTTNTTTVSFTAPASSRTYTVPDSGVSSNFLLSGWAQIVNADISASAAIVYSKLALTGAILNADLAGSIAYSKLSLTGAILNADLAGSIAYSKLVLTTSIVNGDISASAAIARSKLAALTASRLMVTDGSGFDTVSSVTTTEAGYLSGVTSAIQTQFTAKASLVGDTFTGDVIMDNQKGIKFREGSGGGTNFAKIQAPATLAGDYTLTLPVDDGTSGQVLSTDGSGVLSWADVAAGTNATTNLLDNGGFEIWQRGTSFSAPASTAYTADRWKVSTTEAANVTVTKETTTIDGVGLASMKVVNTSTGASKTWSVYQLIENYADYRGKAITVSIRVKTSVASAVKIGIDDGVATSYSSFHTGGGGWETLTASLTVNAATTSLYVSVGMIFVGDKKDGTYYWDSAMLVFGSTASTFYSVSPANDLLRCQRFFQVYGGVTQDTMLCTGQNYTTVNNTYYMQLVVPMRVIPTLTVNNATNFVTTSAAFGNISMTALAIGSTFHTTEICLNGTVAAGLVAGNVTMLYSNNDNASLYLTADL